MKTSINLSDEVCEKIDEMAQAYGLTRSDVIRWILKKELIRLGYFPEVASPMIWATSSKTLQGGKKEGLSNGLHIS